MAGKHRRRAYARVAALYRHQSQGPHLSNEEECGDTVFMQKNQDDDKVGEMEFKIGLNVPRISDIFELCKPECGSRKLSVLIYTIPQHLNYKWREIDSLLHSIDASQWKIAHNKWALTFLNDDFDAFEDDGQGGKHNDGFYNFFLELKTQVKVLQLKFVLLNRQILLQLTWVNI